MPMATHTSLKMNFITFNKSCVFFREIILELIWKWSGLLILFEVFEKERFEEIIEVLYTLWRLELMGLVINW